MTKDELIRWIDSNVDVAQFTDAQLSEKVDALLAAQRKVDARMLQELAAEYQEISDIASDTKHDNITIREAAIATALRDAAHKIKFPAAATAVSAAPEPETRLTCDCTNRCMQPDPQPPHCKEYLTGSIGLKPGWLGQELSAIKREHDSPTDDTESCSFCNGTGIGRYPCNTCKGRGVVPREPDSPPDNTELARTPAPAGLLVGGASASSANGEREGADSAPSQAADGWQPIETAPKDGSRFLAYEKADENCCYEAWWEPDYLKDDWGVNVGGWDDDWDLQRKPTHWQPLPSPPSESTPAGREQPK